MSGSAPRQSGEADPYETLRLMIRGPHLLHAINTSVILGIPDLLQDGPVSSDAIAAKTQPTRRRYIVSYGRWRPQGSSPRTAVAGLR